MENNPTVYIIVGPTASGKSGLALDLAEHLKGVIINADSLQVYAALSILTARPTQEDLNRAPHVLYGTVKNPKESYSVAKWHDDVMHEIENTFAQNKTPVIVGGTGLYIKALLEGLNNVPEIEPSIRETVRQQALTQDGAAQLYQDLQHHDPKGAKDLKANDTQRLIRALEVVLSTGKPLHEWQSTVTTPLSYAHKIIYINPPREEVIERAKERLDVMFEGGALEEVQDLLKQDIPSDCSLKKAVGVREIEAYLAGDLTPEEALEKSFIATRQYIKRQQTWFNRQLKADVTLDHCYRASDLKTILGTV